MENRKKLQLTKLLKRLGGEDVSSDVLLKSLEELSQRIEDFKKLIPEVEPITGEVSTLKDKYRLLDEEILKLSQNIGEKYDSILKRDNTTLSEFNGVIKDLKEELEDTQDEIESLRTSMLQLQSKGGGSAHRKITNNGTEIATRYADLNIIPGDNITLTAADDNTNKRTSLTITNTGFTLPSLTSGSVLFSNGTTIAQDNSNFFWDDTDKRLGIGMNTPGHRLVVGNITAQNTLRINGLSTSNMAPVLSLFRSGSAEWAIGSGGTLASDFVVSLNPSSYTDANIATGAKFVIKSATGNVGIGFSIPSVKLDVNANTILGNSTIGAYVTSDAINNNVYLGSNAYHNGSSWQKPIAAVSALFGSAGVSTAKGFYVYTSASVTAGAISDFVEKLRVPASGPAIFSGTSAIVNVNEAGGGNLNLRTTDTAAVDVGPTLRFSGETGNGVTPYAFASISARKESASAGNYSGYLTLNTIDSGGTIRERVRVNGSGNVGIGTTSPFDDLDVTTSGAGGLGGRIVITNSAATAQNNRVDLGFKASADYAATYYSNRITSIMPSVGSNATDLVFYAYDGGDAGGTEKLRIKNGGNVLIGATAANTAKLSIQGSADHVAEFYSSGTYPYISVGADATHELLITWDTTVPNARFQTYNRASPILFDALNAQFLAGGNEITRINTTGLGIFTTAPSARLDVNLGTTGAFRLTYNDADGSPATYCDFTLSSTGVLTINSTGTGAKVTFSDDVEVPDEVYGAGWNGSTEVPTKNAIYDKIQTMSGGTSDYAVTGVTDNTANAVTSTGYSTGDAVTSIDFGGNSYSTSSFIATITDNTSSFVTSTSLTTALFLKP